MGLLVAKKYATILALRGADHTYVECGSGARAWGCLGGKIGGVAFNDGSGSTERASAIAQIDERANIDCYLVNGVCHQAANRILLPAGILVTGARGYQVSAAIFGPYGRPGKKKCSARFSQYPTITGDIPVCLMAGQIPAKYPFQSAPDRSYFRSTKAAYARFQRFHEQGPGSFDIMKFQRGLFERSVHLYLGDDYDAATLLNVHESVEIEHAHIIDARARDGMTPFEFVTSFNSLTIRLQDEMASSLSSSRYAKLFKLDRDEKILLADPVGVATEFGRGVARNIYPDIQGL